MIKITIEDDDTITGIKDKHCWTLEDAVNVFETVINKHWGTNVEVFVKAKQDQTVEVPINETDGM
tara:strand:- start:687 stop:881 length:195 start_codon:yes stop_codon:yes gene_type:complete